VTIEDAAEDFIQAAVDAAEEGNVLFQAEVKDDYQTITKDYGVIVGDCTSDVAPLAGGAMGEFDALLIMVCFARVVGSDKTERKAARNKARELMLAVAGLFTNDPMMNGQVRDSRVLRCRRGFDSITSADVYAVAHVPVVINETGQQTDLEQRLYQ
jgi:hypothetical protein